MTVEAPIDYTRTPIIVLGVNHSGTRAVVDVLSMLGSDPGHNENEWRENELFIGAHRMLLDARDVREWDARVFDLEYLQRTPDAATTGAVRRMLEQELPTEYPQRSSRPWHWKCPTSAFFMKFWLDIFPDAYCVHVSRDTLDVAGSLVSRRQFYRVGSAVRFCRTAERLILDAAPRRYVHLRYEDLAQSLPRLVAFVPGLRKERIAEAVALIRRPSLAWNARHSLKKNLWVHLTAGRIALARRSGRFVDDGTAA